jgi:hypothetical protein
LEAGPDRHSKSSSSYRLGFVVLALGRAEGERSPLAAYGTIVGFGAHGCLPTPRVELCDEACCLIVTRRPPGSPGAGDLGSDDLRLPKPLSICLCSICSRRLGVVHLRRHGLVVAVAAGAVSLHEKQYQLGGLNAINALLT